jgi:hypothetical protein
MPARCRIGNVIDAFIRDYQEHQVFIPLILFIPLISSAFFVCWRWRSSLPRHDS